MSVVGGLARRALPRAVGRAPGGGDRGPRAPGGARLGARGPGGARLPRARGGSRARLRPRALARLRRKAVAVPVRLRRRLAALALAALAVLGGYLGWLRDSSLVRVEVVRVSGISQTADAARLRAALVDAARDMTTLHVREEELERVAAGYPSVASVTARPELPDALAIRVIERRPVAVVQAAGAAAPVAAGGQILRGVPVRGPLPELPGGGPATGRLTAPPTRRALAVAAAAPAILTSRLRRIAERPGLGLVAELRDGPDVYFGGASDLRAKWVAAVGVLADRASRGATYVDVRLPARPVAGGLAGRGGAGDDAQPGVGAGAGAPGPATAAGTAPATAAGTAAGTAAHGGGLRPVPAPAPGGAGAAAPSSGR